MNLIIDGYNLMYALGRLEKKSGPDRFRKARNRFLNDLADALGAVRAHQTTVVFDAREAPGHLARATSHKGLAVVFADEEEAADARIERLVAAHPAPKSLTVVSTDRRIRQAAARRKARALTAEAFWDEVEAPHPAAPAQPSLTPEEEARLHGLSPEESAEWQAAFGDVASEPGVGEALDAGGFAPSDDEIARIAREVDDEFRDRR